jgi:hypothetical protein
LRPVRHRIWSTHRRFVSHDEIDPVHNSTLRANFDTTEVGPGLAEVYRQVRSVAHLATLRYLLTTLLFHAKLLSQRMQHCAGTTSLSNGPLNLHSGDSH